MNYCRTEAEKALPAMRMMITRLNLTVNESKTRICQLPEETLDFLGCMFGRCYSAKAGRAYLGTVPSKKRVIQVLSFIVAEFRPFHWQVKDLRQS